MSQVSQIRSQSQSQFSQGMSLSQSQLSQSSLEENLMTEQRFGSQEMNNINCPSKRVSSLASVLPARDESQLQLARTSNPVTKRWSTASGQVSEDLENKFRQIEGSLNRLGMIMDSIQNDVIQINRAVKEVSIETGCVRQKIALLDSSMGHVIKEDQLKAFLDANLKSISEQIVNSNGNRLDEIASTLSILPKKMESQLVKFQREVCTVVTEKIEVIAKGMKSFDGGYQDPTQSPRVLLFQNKCRTVTRESQKNHASTYSIIETAAQQAQKSQIPMYSPMLPPVSHTRRIPPPKIEAQIPNALKPKLTGSSHTRRIPLPKIEAEISNALKPKLTGSNHTATFKKEEIPLAPKGMQMKDFRIIIDLDEESDGGVSCLLVEPARASYLDEADEETLRILRKARKRKRKQDKCLILD